MKKKVKGEITKAVVQVKPKAKVEESIKVTNVYSADFKAIDDTIEAIKKISRKVSTNEYSTNNVYLLLQDALKRITLAEK
jgi:hypothetical protein